MRLLEPCAVLIILSSLTVPGLAQSSSGAGPSTAQPPVSAPAQPPDQQNAPPPDPNAQQPPADQAAQPPAQPTPPTRPPLDSPGVRAGGLKLTDAVSVGGYGSVRYEKNTLDNPKPSGFDFRRFVLTTEATPNDRLQAYIEIEFERLAEIEVEREVERFDEGAAFKEELEGGNGG